MALKSSSGDVIRHGEAVGIGMLCEIFYSEGKSKKFDILKKLLLLYGLPTNLKKFINSGRKKSLKKDIFANIFLDKKRISKYPRIVKILQFGKSKIIEMRDNKKIKKTIDSVIF